MLLCNQRVKLKNKHMKTLQEYEALEYTVMLRHFPSKNELATYFSHIHCSQSGKLLLPTR